MQVKTIKTTNSKERYMLFNSNGESVDVVNKYLKYKDSYGSARNTLKTYCYHLKLYFEYLEQSRLDFLDVNIDSMANFLHWLKNPSGSISNLHLKPVESKRSAKSINIIVSVVLDFYDYLLRNSIYEGKITEQLKREMSGSRRGYKGFLYHISKDKTYLAKTLKLKEPKKKPKTLSKEQVEALLDNCKNLRDRFLISLLYESGMRIGEALSLWIEDFSLDGRKVQIRDRGEHENGAEIKTSNAERVIDISDNLINLFIDYISEYHDDNVDTNFVFIKLAGENKYQPMEYPDVDSLFKRLEKKTSIHASAHMLRHTSLTELRRAGMKSEHLQRRAGHADPNYTANTYYHPTEEDIREDWENVSSKNKKQL
mgnify:FL=1